MTMKVTTARMTSRVTRRNCPRGSWTVHFSKSLSSTSPSSSVYSGSSTRSMTTTWLL